MTHAALREKVQGFLSVHQTAVLSTLSQDGRPESATVTGVWDEEFSFYFFTNRDSRKFKNLMLHPYVSIVVGTEPTTPGTVQAEGLAEMMEDHADARQFAEVINLAAWPLLRQRGMDWVFFKVRVNWLRWLDVTELQDAPGENVFHQLVPVSENQR